MHFATACVLLLQAGSALAGIKSPPKPMDKSTPVQQRLSFKSPTSISVAWNTYRKLEKPCVKYGTNKANLAKMTCSTSSITYPSSRTWTNLVHLTGLTPATKYYYKIVSTNSEMAYFMSPRTAGDDTPFTMLTLADLGLHGKDGYMTKKRSEIPQVQPSLNHTTIQRMALTVDDYEFIIHPGDLAYADDWIEDPTNYDDGAQAYSAIIEKFYEQLAPVSGHKPYMVSPGNHEADCTEVGYVKGVSCPEGQYNFSDFTNRFEGMMPTVFDLKSANSTAAASRNLAKRQANPPFWYSFDYGMVHVVMIDTETDFPDAPDEPGGSQNLDSGPFGRAGQQLNFIKNDLASVDRRVTPWVVVAGHRPWYTNGDMSSPCGPCQAAFEDLFYKYGVDVGVFGHIHNMQRFLPIYKNTVDPAGMKNPKAPMYTVIGGPGNIEGHSDTTPATTGNAFAYNTQYGFGHLTFRNKTHMDIDFYASPNGNNLDHSTLIKQHNVPFVRNA